MFRLRRVWLALGVALGLMALLPLPSAHALNGTFVAQPFRAFYREHEGMRLLGAPRSGLRTVNGYPSQYFEKGRLEDHRAEVTDPVWALMYGRLTVELMERAPGTGANSSSLTYADLRLASQERVPAPRGFTGGTLAVADGRFVPYDARLGVAGGYVVPDYFWGYINRADLFPGGWLHDVGLPLTRVLSAETVKQGVRRTIMLQAFERTILTYDPQNPPAWQVERGNIGTDALQAEGRPQPPAANAKRIEIDLSEQWLRAYAGDEVVYDAPVSTGRDGFNTPRGTFKIYSKYPIKTMRGSLGGESWEVPDVPHAMFFNGAVALHGAYWHNQFGTGARLSHGCVNLPLEAARLLFEWAPVGTQVTVRA